MSNTINSIKTQQLRVTYSVRRTAVARSLNAMIAILALSYWMPGVTSIGDFNINALLIVPVLLLSFMYFNFLYVAPADSGSYWIIIVTSIAIFSFAMLSATWAYDPFRVTRVMLSQLVAITLMLGIVATNNMGFSNRYLYQIMIFGAAGSGILAVVGHVVPALGYILSAGGDRSQAFFKVANQFGIALSTALPIAIAYGFSARWPLSRLLAVVGAIFIGLAMSGSKSGMAVSAVTAVACTVVCLHVTGYTKKNPFIIPALLIAGCLAAWGFYMLLMILNPRSVTLMTQFAQDGEIQSTLARERIWTKSFQIGLTHPVTGEGAGQRVGGFDYPHSHNVVLDYFRSMGIPGLTGILVILSCVLGMSASTIWQSSRGSIQVRCRAVGCAFAAMIYIGTNMLSDSFGPSTSPLFWIAVALLFCERQHLYAARLNMSRTADKPTRPTRLSAAPNSVRSAVRVGTETT